MSGMGSDDFVEAVKAKADLGDGYLVTSTRNRYTGNYDSAHIAFYNVPKEIGRGGGGAVAMNNRLLMFVDGFGKEENEPPPKGKVKFRVGASELLPREKRPRGKTASPERMVDYVAKIITDASKLPANLPPGRAANPTHALPERRGRAVRYEAEGETLLVKMMEFGDGQWVYHLQLEALRAPGGWPGPTPPPDIRLHLTERGARGDIKYFLKHGYLPRGRAEDDPRVRQSNPAPVSANDLVRKLRF